MERNKAPRELEGNYTVFVKGNMLTLTNLDTKECVTARCAPEDEYSVAEGVNVAIEKMLEAREAKKIRVGEIVEVTDGGQGWGTLDGIFVDYPEIAKYAARYRYGVSAEPGTKGVVKAIVDKTYYIVESYGHYYGDPRYNSLSCRGIYILKRSGLKKVDK